MLIKGCERLQLILDTAALRRDAQKEGSNREYGWVKTNPIGQGAQELK